MSTQVVSLFKPSSKSGSAETSTTHRAPRGTSQPLSYAEFVVQSKTRADERPGHGPQTGDLPQDVLRATGQTSDMTRKCGSLNRLSTDAGKTPEPALPIAGSESSAVPGRLEEDLGQGQKSDEGQSTEERTVNQSAVGSGTSIIVSPRQVQECFICQNHTVKICYWIIDGVSQI